MTTLDELYAFFEAIPEDRWCRGAISSGGRHCAVGHLIQEPRNIDTWRMLSGIGLLAPINDDETTGLSPKQNVLAYLRREIEKHR